MDIQHTFEVYRQQLDNIRKNDYYGRPQILRQFRLQFKGFSDADIETIKSFLLENDKKWFVAHLLDNLDTFPVELLKPMLNAAVDEPNPSFNNEFIKPCRRVFDCIDIQKILLNIFQNGDVDKKTGVLKALYWARRTVYKQTVYEGSKAYHKYGYSKFFWDYELDSFNEDFEEDEEVFRREAPKQEEAYNVQVKTLTAEFYKTKDIELKYQIALGLPRKVIDFPKDLRGEAASFLKSKERESVPNNIAELNKVQNVGSSFVRKIILSISRRFSKKGGITLKQR
jgi:hypothetical protein